MQKVDIRLEESWETLDDAIGYFLNLVLDLKSLQRLPNPPTDIFLTLEGTELPDDFWEKHRLKLVSL